MIKRALLWPLVPIVLGGCLGNSQATVSAQDEQLYKHPQAIDMSKIPASAFQHKGPAFIGQPTGATGRHSAPPASVTTGQ